MCEKIHWNVCPDSFARAAGLPCGREEREEAHWESPNVPFTLCLFAGVQENCVLVG